MSQTLASPLAVLVPMLVGVGAFMLHVSWQLHRIRRRGTYSPLTEDLLRLPGHSLREQGDELQDRAIELYLRCIAMGIVTAGFWVTVDDASVRWIGTLTAAVIVLWTCRQAAPLLERVRRVNLGRECEEYVGQELNLLMREGAFVFHDIPYRYGNIDHVVVGHDRVLVVETKGRRKPRGSAGGSAGEGSRDATVRFDGRTLAFPDCTTAEPIEQARRHAKHVAEALRRELRVELPVLPVVALPGWFVDSVPHERGGVLVVNAKRAKVLRCWLGKRGDRTRTDAAARYFDSLARSVAPGSRRSDPDAAWRLDRATNPRPVQPMPV